MPYTAFSRMKDEIAVGFIIAIFTTFFAVIVPNYQKYAYENTEAKRYSEYENNAGYPAAEGFPTVNSLADIDEAKNRNFTITLNVSKLTPLDFYMDIVGRTYSTSGFMRKIDNNDVGGIGRFFIAELASGEQVWVFLDDTSINLPEEGTVTLPIGVHKLLGEGKFLNVLREKSGMSEAACFVDMAGKWREGPEAKKADDMRWYIGMAVFVVIWISSSLLLFVVTGEKRKDKIQ